MGGRQKSNMTIMKSTESLARSAHSYQPTMETKTNKSSIIENILPPELLVSVAMWLDVNGYVKFQHSNQQIYKILKDAETTYIRQLTLQENVHTLPQLFLFLELKGAGFLKENRLGFGYASTEIAIDDDEDENDDISDENSVERARRTPSVRGSLQRVNMIRRWMTKFPSMTVRLDSHSGIIAPSEIAEAFSRTRGMAVRSALQSGLDENKRSEIDIRDRISVHPWGRRVALLVAAEPSHPFRDLARCGKGWVQICVELDGMHVPPDPFFDSDLNVCLTES